MRICPPYINWYTSRDSRQSSRSSLIMRIKTLSAIVACSGLLLVNGLDSTASNGTVDSSGRILNGIVASPANFLFAVLLVRPVSEEDEKICGGSIISNHFILTASHCIFNYPCTEQEIFPSTWVPGAIPSIHAVSCHPHEKSTGRDYFFDIGLIKTQEDLVKDSLLKVIPLAAPGTIYVPGDQAIIAGWGTLEDGSDAQHLMWARVPVYSWSQCNARYAAAKECADDMLCPVAEIPDHSMCTLGSPPGFPGPCFGDSGGPVIIKGFLAGVMSGMIVTSKIQCTIGSPGLNIDVSKFVPWIDQFIQAAGDKRPISVEEEIF